ncbi:MAG: methionyl-tRNA formyltransferase [Candidatus Binatia bacterium]|nr:methionyl-tRNA formyltransferase [Candidatus Binatia bacterium]
MGTPEFAVPSLRTLMASEDRVVGVVTQPDQPAGRGMALQAPPVKKLAAVYGIPVMQPAKLRDPAVLAQLQAWQPDLIVVAAYGKILPPALLTLPPYGCINVHASLLPKYRGAAPIQWAIINGESETGVTIMRVSERMDAGDILLQKTLPITESDTGGTLHDKLATLGAEALRETLALLKGGQLVARPQNEAEATYAPKITKEDGWIEWRQEAVTIARRIRAFNPWPSAYTTLGGKLFKIFAARVVPSPVPPRLPGTIIEVTPVSLVVATGNGALALLEVQLEGKKRLAIEEFLNGYHLSPGLVLGS